MRRQRIGIFAHSTNPRGGVVHAMQLAEALDDAGHDATLLAPALPGAAFARPPRCRSVLIPVQPVQGVAAMVARRIDEVTEFLAGPAAPRFDIHHAQDPITANALAELARRDIIGGFVRTVHHLDDFADARLAEWQDVAVRTAARVCCVSRLWQGRIAKRYGIGPALVGNGVDAVRFSAASDDDDAALRERLGVGGGPVFVTIGGIEPRKNTLGVLRAFLRVREIWPSAVLVIAGGATLLEHGTYHAAFQQVLDDSGAGASVIHAGVIADADMPALYRMADAAVCASVEEGFGLCVIEALASSTPTVVSRIAPFTEHLLDQECHWADPHDVEDIARAMRAAVKRPRIAPQASARFTWADVAARHAPVYAALSETEHAYA